MAQIGYGSKVEINDGVASAFVEVSNLVSIKPPAEKVTVVPSKKLNGTSRTNTSVPGMNEPGEFQFTYEYTDTEFDRIEALRRDATTHKPLNKSFKITIEDETADTVKTISGFVTSNEMDNVEAESITMVTVTVQLT